MMVETVPRIAIGLPLLIIPIFLIIGLFIFAAVKFGKDKPWVIAVSVGAAVLAVPGVLLVLLNVLHFVGVGGGGARLKLMFVPVFLIPGLLILGLIIFAVIKSGKGKGLLVALGVVALIAVVLLGAILFTRPSVRTQKQVMQIKLRAPTAQATKESAIWHEGVEKQFLADVYPSRRAAVLALGRQIAETTIQSYLADAQVSRQIALLQDDHDRGLLTELARQIEQYSSQHGTGKPITCRVLQNLGSDPWRTDTDNTMATQLKLWVRLGFDDAQTKRMSWNDDKASSGKVWLKVKGPDGISSTEVRFAEKPWVESFPDFLSSNPSRDLALARSADSCISRQEAHRQALADATSRISQMLRSLQRDSSVVPVSMEITENDLSSGKFIADTFTQRFSGLAGPIWREAILIDTSQSKLNKLAERKITITREKRLDWAKMAGTLIGMFALICVVYLFLNAATRGYYAWSLRIVLMAVLGIAMFLFLILA
ncbi:MAG: hypothetical protein DRP66_08440 [Planctomycetota bacterium]|nr:MAG: hypothetical protein DRP66_08440 [Planctomycetota bacterium]